MKQEQFVATRNREARLARINARHLKQLTGSYDSILNTHRLHFNHMNLYQLIWVFL